jgi:hypothetical protein
MTESWHYRKGGQQRGPVSSAELRSLARHGFITPDDLVWKTGMANWIKAGQLKGLFPAATVVDTSPPSLSTPIITVNTGLKPRPPMKYRTYVFILLSLVAIVISSVMFTKVISYFTPSRVTTHSDDARITESNTDNTSGITESLLLRSSAEQESLRQRARQIKVGMTEREVTAIMGCRRDTEISYTDTSPPAKAMCWDTGGLGVIVIVEEKDKYGLPTYFVCCVSEGSSGYHHGEPPRFGRRK